MYRNCVNILQLSSIKTQVSIIFLLLFIGWNARIYAQPIPPDIVTARIAETSGQGCTNLTDCSSEIICFDVYLMINQAGWSLQSYNIWVDFGPDNQVLDYLNDDSCYHSNGGSTDFSEAGKFRFLAGQNSFHLNANEEHIIHNICFSIEDFSGLEGLQMNAGGDVFGLVSSVNIVDQNNSSFTDNPAVALGQLITLGPGVLSCMDIAPFPDHDCDDGNLNFFSDPVDASGDIVLDCEPFTYSWTGPEGFSSDLQNPVIQNPDLSVQGIYTVVVSGSTGCLGMGNVEISQENCSSLVPLSIALIDFWGTERKTYNYLEWKVENNADFDHFILQRRLDGEKEFEDIGKIKSGESNTFSFEDYDISRSGLYYYRLLSLENDGIQQNSEIVKLKVNHTAPGNFILYPNPFEHHAELEFDLASKEVVSIELMDLNGKTIAVVCDARIFEKGNHKITLDYAYLDPGIYIVKMLNRGNYFSEKLVKM